MVRHTADLSRTLDAMRIGEIEDRILIEFWDHRRLAVTPGRFYILTESITVATGCGKGDGGQQLHLVDGDSLAATGVTFPDGKVAGLKDREQLIPIVQEHAHGVGNIRMDHLHIVE
jgi:hypothetical protein